MDKLEDKEWGMGSERVSFNHLHTAKDIEEVVELKFLHFYQTEHWR